MGVNRDLLYCQRILPGCEASPLTIVRQVFMTRTLPRRCGVLLTAALAILLAPALLAQMPPSPQTPMKGDRRAWVWYFGTGVGLSFATGAPVPLERGPMIAAEGCASVCDAR